MLSYSAVGFLLQMDDAGVPDLDTMVSMLPDSMQDRGGKMIMACKGISEYRHTGRHRDASFSPN
jgi:hypothetical protein